VVLRVLAVQLWSKFAVLDLESSRNCTTDARLRTPAHPAADGCVAAATRGGAGSGGCATVTRLRTGHGRRARRPRRTSTALSAFGGVLRVDALSAFMVIVIGAIGLLAVCQSVRYLEREVSRVARARVARRSTRCSSRASSRPCCSRSSRQRGVMWWPSRRPRSSPRSSSGTGARGKPSRLVEVRHHLLGRYRARVPRHRLVYLAALHAGGVTHVSLQWTSLMSVAHHARPG